MIPHLSLCNQLSDPYEALRDLEPVSPSCVGLRQSAVCLRASLSAGSPVFIFGKKTTPVKVQNPSSIDYVPQMDGMCNRRCYSSVLELQRTVQKSNSAIAAKSRILYETCLLQSRLIDQT